jgi:hypothetical protein
MQTEDQLKCPAAPKELGCRQGMALLQTMAKRVLFLVSTSCEQASTRYRVLQYLPALKAAGFDATVSPFLSPAQERRLYNPGISLRKLLDLVAASSKRLFTVLHSASFDFVVVGREAMLYGPPFLEWWTHRVCRRPVIFDYDDAVWISDCIRCLMMPGHVAKRHSRQYNIWRLECLA